MKPKAIIVDLDGTLANLRGRNPYDGTEIDKDLVNNLLAKVLEWFLDRDVKLIIATGRIETYRLETEKWLHDHEINYDVLLMRPADDIRSAVELKEDWLLHKMLPLYEIVLAFDDMWRVADMYRSHDIQCWQVDKDPFYK
ncbi:MAG: hypothetical protein KGI08_10285 [Thaumarchaeota archaeon]|nr:hypothetical protein [Nitrososphaerota archaeon]